jgi:hypothetical protein
VEVEKALVVRAEDWPYGLRCGECHREMTDGENYSRRLSGFVEDAPVSVVVCVPCALGLAAN